MNENYYIQLVYKRLRGELNAAQLLELETWVQADSANAETASGIEQAWMLSENFPKPFSFDLESEFSKLQNRIEEDEKIQTPIQRTLQAKPRFRIARIAAAIALLLVSGSIIWNNFFNTPDYISLQTTSAETKELVLPDGSKVWLNENTELQYPNVFNTDSRIVKLTGEAFFDVEKDQNRPFSIETKQNTIKVLGTSFNVKAVPDENTTSVFVRTGKVRFQHRYSDVYTNLAKDQKGIFYHANQKIEKVEKPSFVNDLYWKNNQLFFNKVKMTEVISTLESYFDVQLIVEEAAVKQCVYTRTLPFEDPTAIQIMESIADVFQAKLKKTKQGHYRLKGGVCQ